MGPGIGHGIFEIEHDARRAGIEHFHDELGVVGRTRHLIALVGAPIGECDSPGGISGIGRGQIMGQ